MCAGFRVIVHIDLVIVSIDRCARCLKDRLAIAYGVQSRTFRLLRVEPFLSSAFCFPHFITHSNVAGCCSSLSCDLFHYSFELRSRLQQKAINIQIEPVSFSLTHLACMLIHVTSASRHAHTRGSSVCLSRMFMCVSVCDMYRIGTCVNYSTHLIHN